MNFKNILATIAVGAAFATPAFSATVGSVVAFGDEWTLSDVAFDGGTPSGDFFAGDRPSAEALSANLADLLGGTTYTIAGGNAVAYGSSFESYLETSQGKTVNRVFSDAALSAALATSDALFLAGNVGTGSIALLDAFVANGGSVVVSLGTGNLGSASAEAARWNPFLNGYGLQAASVWTTDPNFTPITVTETADGDVDDGVGGLLWGYGNEISLTGSNADAYLFGGNDPQDRVISAVGVAPAPQMSAVPLPAGLPLILVGLGAFALVRRKQA